jgi:phosphoribosylpyrophosphate synthetase
MTTLAEMQLIGHAVAYDNPHDRSAHPRAKNGAEAFLSYGEFRSDKYTRDREGHYLEDAEALMAYVILDSLRGSYYQKLTALDPHGHKAALQFQQSEGRTFTAITALGEMSTFAKKKGIITPNESWIIVPPDDGSLGRAEYTAKESGIALGGRVVKSRKGGEVHIEDVYGDMTGKSVILPDDMIATGSTLGQTAIELRKRGARKVIAFTPHVIGVDGADKVIYDMIKSGQLDDLVVSNSTPYAARLEGIPGVHFYDVQPLLEEYMRNELLGLSNDAYVFPLRSFYDNLKSVAAHYPHLVPDIARAYPEQKRTNGVVEQELFNIKTVVTS